MKILYAGVLAPGSSALFRLWALERMGHTVIPLNTDIYQHRNRLLHTLSFRLSAGPEVLRLNRDLLDLARREQPDVLWADKVLFLQPRTLRKLHSMGITAVSYMIDNAFGPRNDPGWRLYMASIPHFDLHVTQRDVNIPEYRKRGARDVLKIQTAYEQTIHFPPPPSWSDRDRTRDVSFIGTPYDDRAQFLQALDAAGVPVTISGNTRQWQRALDPQSFAKLFRHGELYEQEYREAIWGSKINLSFLTHSNQDEFTHKSFEIAACAGFLLAERSQGHADRFVEDVEAVFFSTQQECLEKIRRYLPDEAARSRIATAGRRRAERDGYHNDRQVRLIIDRLDQLRSTRNISRNQPDQSS